MSADWIEGRFEGVYSGPRRSGDDSGARRDDRRRRSAHSELRRFGFEIESGDVRDLTPCEPPDPDDVDAEQVIRQSRVKRVRLPDADGQESERETSLFDAHISDWQLKHPAEAGDRAYGTIVGTIRARRRPTPTEPATPPIPTVPASPPTPSRPNETPRTSQGPSPDSRTSAAPAVKHARDESGDPAVMVSRMGWAAALVLLAVVFAALAYTCGPRHAAIWLAPIALALLQRWLAPDGVLTRVPWWLSGALVTLQLLVVWSLLELAWQTGCWPALGIVQLAVLATPVMLSAIFGSRGALWMTGTIWTVIACASCAGGDANACRAAIAAEPVTPAEAPRTDRGPRRTDAQGRWPVMPPLTIPGLGPDAGISSESSSGRAPGPGLTRGGGQEPGPGSGGIALPDPVAASESSSGAASDPPSLPSMPLPPPAAVPTNGPAPLPAPDDAPTHATAPVPHAPAPTHSARPSPTADPATSGDHRLTQVDGGWLSPDHRRAPREHVLISIEQANRTPALFFDGGGGHRVYVPTDPIFKQGSADLRRGAPLVLARVAALLSLPSKPRVVLEVHSDSAGAPESQTELCRRRAASIRSWLADRGHIAPSRFAMRAVGGGRPLVPPDGNYAAQQPNRRIEIRLIEDD